MLKVGITGGIGGGKSTVSKIIELFGYPVYNSDNQARLLMESNTILVSEIKQLLGNEAYIDSKLNRPFIASKVFTSAKLLKRLESIVHPTVERDFNAWSSAQRSKLVFKEAAILFESGGDKYLDAVICVTAPEAERKQRVLKRDKMTMAQVEKRMSKQWHDDKKIALSDYVIYADDEHSVIHQVRAILLKLNAKVS